MEQKNETATENVDKEQDETTSFIQDKYRIDIAGRLFSYVASSRIPSVYRFWATMKDLIKVDLLQKSLNSIMKRFPYYQVKLKNGFLWNYWKTTNEIPKVENERKYPCQYIPMREANAFPFRVIVNLNEIIVEFSHSITDGSGALIFLKTLIADYLTKTGQVIENWGSIYRADDKPDKSEFEYSYRKNFKLGFPKIERDFRAFQLPFELEDKGVFHVVKGKLLVTDVLKVSKEFKVTLTEFLATIYIEVLQEILFDLPEKQQKKLKRPIKIMVPINVRNLIPSHTMRNFTAFVAPGIDPRLGEFSFEEIIEQVHHYKNMFMNKKYINQQISNFVYLEINPYLHFTPSFIKKWFIKPLYRDIGESQFSAIMTNLGRTSLPHPINKEVSDLHLLPMNHPYFKSGCALLTYYDELNINFGRNYADDVVERKFFEKVKKHNITTTITEHSLKKK